VLVISGKSATGKDQIVKELCEMGFSRITTFTTRPKRKGEIDGVDYHFLNVKDFLKKYTEGFFIEIKYYTTADGIWYYGSSLDSVENSTDNDVIILTPSGVNKLINKNVTHTSFLLNVSDDEIKKRQLHRGDNNTEAERRFKADMLDFSFVGHLYKFVIDNENKTANEAAIEIIEKYKGR
jgi:guanylate kinase